VIITKQSHEIIGYCPTDFVGNLRLIEKAGRTCYQSWNKVTNDSCLRFAKKLAESGHFAMIEHSNLVIRFAGIDYDDLFCDSKFLTVNSNEIVTWVGGNFRAWMEWLGIQNILDLETAVLSHIPYPQTQIVRDLNAIPSELKRFTVKFNTSRNNSHELVRHRPASFAQLSQRYVDHTRDMTFILPVHYYNDRGPAYELWVKGCEIAEKVYKELKQFGESNQQARSVLPNCFGTELIITADMGEWHHIFNLRCSTGADPNMQDLMIPLRQEMMSTLVL
jgi:thymidylate synthase (FAD)